MAENKITKQQAAEMLNMSLDEKFAQTYANITDWYYRWSIYNNNAGAYISFSGGKDSTVLAYITAMVLSTTFAGKIPLILMFCDTGLEFSQIRSFVKEFPDWLKTKFPSLTIILEIRRPKKNFKEIIKQHGYPLISKAVAHNVGIARRNPDGNIMKNMFNPNKKGPYAMYPYSYLLEAPFMVSDVCCNIMKKAPAHIFSHREKLMCITAEMAEESKLRKDKWLQYSCNGYDLKEPKSMAMAFWTEQDVLKFIFDNNIPLASVYGDVISYTPGISENQISLFETEQCNYKCSKCQRTGCVFCGFGAHLEKGKNRYQILKEIDIKKWEYCIGGGEYVNGIWQANNKGLGFAVPLEYVGIKYE